MTDLNLTLQHRTPAVNGFVGIEAIARVAVAGMPSPQTRRVYISRLREFLTYLQTQPGGISRSLIQTYLREMRERGMGASAVNQALSAVKKLVGELGERDLLDRTTVESILGLKGERVRGIRTGNWLTSEQAWELVNAPETSKRNRSVGSLRNRGMGKGSPGEGAIRRRRMADIPVWEKRPGGEALCQPDQADLPQMPGQPRAERDNRLRDRALLALMVGCGVRRAEAAGLTWDRFVQRWDRWVLADIMGKGGRVRTVAVPDWAADRLLELRNAAVTSAAVTSANQSVRERMDHGPGGGVACQPAPANYPGRHGLRADAPLPPLHPLPENPAATARFLPDQPSALEVLPEMLGDRCNESGDGKDGGDVDGTQLGPGCTGTRNHLLGNFMAHPNQLQGRSCDPLRPGEAGTVSDVPLPGLGPTLSQVPGHSDTGDGAEQAGGQVNAQTLGSSSTGGMGTTRQSLAPGGAQAGETGIYTVRDRSGEGIQRHIPPERSGERSRQADTVPEVCEAGSGAGTDPYLSITHRAAGAAVEQGNPLGDAVRDGRGEGDQAHQSAESGSIFHLTESGIWWVVKSYADRLGLKVRPHDLRRTHAQLSRLGGASIEQIQITLGHAHIATTERYLKTGECLKRGEASPDFIRLPFLQSSAT